MSIFRIKYVGMTHSRSSRSLPWTPKKTEHLFEIKCEGPKMTELVFPLQKETNEILYIINLAYFYLLPTQR